MLDLLLVQQYYEPRNCAPSSFVQRVYVEKSYQQIWTRAAYLPFPVVLSKAAVETLKGDKSSLRAQRNHLPYHPLYSVVAYGCGNNSKKGTT